MTDTDTAALEAAERAAGTVTDAGTDGPAKDATAERGKGDDLDALLREFEGTAPGDSDPDPKAAKPAEGGGVDASLDPAKLRRAVEISQQWEAEQTARDVQTTVTAIKAASDDLADIPDEWIEARLNVMAARDPKLSNAWANRKVNPGAWQRVQGALAERLGSEVASRGRSQGVQEREAATAAARGRTTTPPPAQKFDSERVKGMSIDQLEAFERELRSKSRG